MKPLLLMILDGWGWREEREGNAILLAKTPNWDRMFSAYPHTLLKSSGLAVGLPEGTMGNSEVGHLNIGAGRVVWQEYTRINRTIEDGSFFKNDVLKETFGKLEPGGGALHLMGLVSDAGVHSHLNHLYALIEFALREGVNKIFIHCFTDGRDSPPDSGVKYIRDIESRILDLRSSNLQVAPIGRTINGATPAIGRTLKHATPPTIRIATVTGRYYAMDRDKRWDRIEKAYRAIVDGVGRTASSATEAIEKAYALGETDEFISPSVVTPTPKAPPPFILPLEGGGIKGGGVLEGDIIRDGDAVVFFNFRADRARQLTRAMTDEKFAEFPRRIPKLTKFICMTEYDEKFGLPVVFPPQRLTNIFGEVISKAGLKQLRIAETEKYAHVTFFFNGGQERLFPGEDRVLIPSPREVPTYDKRPEMSARKVTGEVISRLGAYDVVILNFANSDMVGHTGVMKAAVEAVEVVDECMGKVVDAVLAKDGVILITGDHGNCEMMLNGAQPHTAHTTGLVPLVLVGKGLEGRRLREGGVLADIAPTMFELLGIERPAEMDGRSLLIINDEA